MMARGCFAAVEHRLFAIMEPLFLVCTRKSLRRFSVHRLKTLNRLVVLGYWNRAMTSSSLNLLKQMPK